jgi:hypothetical protein
MHIEAIEKGHIYNLPDAQAAMRILKYDQINS